MYGKIMIYKVSIIVNINGIGNFGVKIDKKLISKFEYTQQILHQKLNLKEYTKYYLKT